jgi:hypothetical protein
VSDGDGHLSRALPFHFHFPTRKPMTVLKKRGIAGSGSGRGTLVVDARMSLLVCNDASICQLCNLLHFFPASLNSRGALDDRRVIHDALRPQQY